jgi:DNA-binding transcriptional regulator YhcF (GntR family)
MILEVNVETGEEVLREMNAAEIVQLEKDKAQKLANEQAQTAKSAEKAALLAKLGITEDEAKLLLG